MKEASYRFVLLITACLVLCIAAVFSQFQEKQFAFSVPKSSCFNGFQLRKEYYYKFSATVNIDNANFRNGKMAASQDIHIFSYGLKITPVALSKDSKAMFFRLSVAQASFNSLFANKKVQKQANDIIASAKLLEELQRPYYYKQDCEMQTTQVFYPKSEKANIVKSKQSMIESLTSYFHNAYKYTNIQDTVYGGVKTFAYEQTDDESTGCKVITKQIVPDSEQGVLAPEQELVSTTCFKQEGDGFIPTEVKTFHKAGYEHQIYIPGQEEFESDISEGAYMTAEGDTTMAFESSSTVEDEEHDTLANVQYYEEEFADALGMMHGESMEASRPSLDKILAKELEQNDAEKVPTSQDPPTSQAVIFDAIDGLRQASSETRRESFHTLIETLRSSPSSLNTLKVYLDREFKFDNRSVQRSVVNAIAYSHVNGSQVLLAKLLRDNSPDIREAAAFAALALKQPSSEIIQVLKDAVSRKDVRGKNASFYFQCLLALGHAVAKLSKYPSRKEDADSTYAFITHFLENSIKDERLFELEIGLMALENAKRPESFDFLRSHLIHSSPSIRAAAISAIKQFRHTAETEAFIRNGLGDSSSFVRFMSAKSLTDFASFSPETERRIIEQLISEKDSNVKGELIRLVQHHHSIGNNAAGTMVELIVSFPDFFLAVTPAVTNITTLVAQNGVLSCIFESNVRMCSGNGAVNKAYGDHVCWCQCNPGWKGRRCEKPDCSSLKGWDKLDCLAANGESISSLKAKRNLGDVQEDEESASTLAASKLRVPVENLKAFNVELKAEKEKLVYQQSFGTGDIQATISIPASNSFTASENSIGVKFFVGGSITAKLWTAKLTIFESYFKLYGSFDSSKCAAPETAGSNLVAGVYASFLNSDDTNSKTFVGFSADLCQKGDACQLVDELKNVETHQFGEVSFFKVEHTVVVGPVPVKFAAKLSGSLALEYGLQATIESQNQADDLILLQGQIAPVAAAAVTGELGVDLLIVSAGLLLKVNLIEIKIPAVIGHGITTKQTCLSVGIRVEALGGKIGVWVQVLFARFDATLYDWSSPVGFTKNFVSTSCCPDCEKCKYGNCDKADKANPVCTTCWNGVNPENCDLPCPTTMTVSRDTTSWICNGYGLEGNSINSCQFKVTGESSCNCKPWRYGVACESECPKSGNQYCSGQGTCGQSTAGACKCNEGAWGTKCEFYCPDTPNGKCSGNGLCHYNKGNPKCKCDVGFIGKNCELTCPSYNDKVCNNKGKCIEQDGASVCRCQSGFSGNSCELIGGTAGHAVQFNVPTKHEYPNTKLADTPLTIEFWFKASNKPDKVKVISVANLITVKYADNSKPAIDCTTVLIPKKTEWKPISLSFSFQKSAKQFSVSVSYDGNELVKKNCKVASLDSTLSFEFGKLNTIDEVRVWRLNKQELDDVIGSFTRRLSTSQGSQEPGLFSYLAFDEAEGSSAYDEVLERMTDFPMHLPDANYVTSEVPIEYDTLMSPFTMVSDPFIATVGLKSNARRLTSASVILRVMRSSLTYSALSQRNKESATGSALQLQIDEMRRELESTNNQETSVVANYDKLLHTEAKIEKKKLQWQQQITTYTTGYNKQLATCSGTLPNVFPASATYPKFVDNLKEKVGKAIDAMYSPFNSKLKVLLNTYYLKYGICHKIAYQQYAVAARNQCTSSKRLVYPIPVDQYKSYASVIIGLLDFAKQKFSDKALRKSTITKIAIIETFFNQYVELKKEEAKVRLYEAKLHAFQVAKSIITKDEDCFTKDDLCKNNDLVARVIESENPQQTSEYKQHAAFAGILAGYVTVTCNIKPKQYPVVEDLLKLSFNEKAVTMKDEKLNHMTALEWILSQYSNAERIIEQLNSENQGNSQEESVAKKIERLSAQMKQLGLALKENQILINGVPAAHLGTFKEITDRSTNLGDYVYLEWPIRQEAYYAIKAKGMNKIDFNLKTVEYGEAALKIVIPAANRYVKIQKGNKLLYSPSFANSNSRARLMPEDELTFAAWLKVSKDRKNARVFGNSEAGGYAFNLFTADLFFKPYHPKALSIPTFNVPKNQWYHYAVVVDSMMMRVFINGEEIYSYPLSSTILNYKDKSAFVTNLQFGDDFIVDEVVFYSRAVSKEFIRGIMVGGPDILSTSNTDENYDDINQGMAMLLNFEEKAAGEQMVADDSGNGNSFKFLNPPERDVVRSFTHTWQNCPGVSSDPNKPNLCSTCKYNPADKVFRCHMGQEGTPLFQEVEEDKEPAYSSGLKYPFPPPILGNRLQ